MGDRQQGEQDGRGVTSSERNAQTLQSSEPGHSEARSEGPSMAHSGGGVTDCRRVRVQAETQEVILTIW